MLNISSKLVLGTWQFGADVWANVNDDNSIKTAQKAIECGITAIDTAIVYGNGKSERVLGRAIKDIKRDSLQIYSKVFANMLTPENVIKSCNKSLENLNLDYLDLFQIHWPAGSFGTDLIPLSETLSAFNQLKSEGKIKSIGISNFSVAQIKEALKHAEIDTLQPSYSLFWRHIERDIYPLCLEHNIKILAYSPLAQGLLTGKFKDNKSFVTGDNRNYNKLFESPHFEKAVKALDKLQVFADKYNCSLANLALAWLMHQKNVYPIVGARMPEQIAQTSKAIDIKLDAKDTKEIAEIGMSVAKPFLQDPKTHHFEADWEKLK